jgi:Domain of unknown function (DUF4232)
MTSLHRHLRHTAAAAALASVALASADCSGGQSVTPAAQASGTPADTSSSTAPATPTPTGTPAPTSTGTPAPAKPPCPTSALQVSIGPGNGAAGSSYYPLDFTNTSGAACTLFGYPGVSFVTGVGGTQIGRAASRNPALASEPVTIPAGGVAHTTLQVVNAANFPRADCHPVTAHWLKIYPPNQTAPLFLSFTATACARRARQVGILAVEAVRPGAS